MKNRDKLATLFQWLAALAALTTLVLAVLTPYAERTLTRYDVIPLAWLTYLVRPLTLLLWGVLSESSAA